MAYIAQGTRGRNESGRFLRRLQGSLLFSPLILLFVLAVFLAQFGQIREILIRVVEPASQNAHCGSQLVLGFLAFAALTAMLFFSYLSACVVLRQAGIGYGGSLVYGSEVELRQDRSIVWWRDGAALLCAAMPIIGVGVGFASASNVVHLGRELVGQTVSKDPLPLLQLCAADASQVPAQLARVAGVWTILAVILLVSLFAASRLVVLRGWHIGLRRTRTQRHWLMNVFAAAVLLLPVPMINLNPQFNEALFNFIGPLATLGLVLMSSAWLLFVIGEYSRRKGIPVFLITAILVFVVGLLLWAKGSDLPPQKMQSAQEKASAAAAFQASFVEWLRNRTDRAKYTRPYPVYILAAPGGGIYAASFVASVVSRIEARCPGFSQHVFAISAVSGGAIGSSLVDAISHETGQKETVVCRDPPQDDPQVKLVKAMLSDDHLSPTMANTVPDALSKLALIGFYELQRLGLRLASGIVPATWLPFRIELSGRAEALEVSLTESVRRACALPGSENVGLCHPKNGNPLNLRFDEVWRAEGAAPALLLNTTWAETGQRIAFSPFPLSGVGDDTLTAMSELRAINSDDDNETLVTAAVASARFPAVLPAMIEAPKDKPYWWNFVDGGYADASGATTALELYEAIEKNQEEIEKTGMRFDLKLLLLTESTTDPKTPSGPGLSHAISPVTTLLTIRQQIGRRAVARVMNGLRPAEPRPGTSQATALDCASGYRSRMRRIILNNVAFELPLGWMLSRHTADTIDRIVNFPEAISYAGKTLDDPVKLNLLRNANENAETFRAIEANLSDKCAEAPPASP